LKGWSGVVLLHWGAAAFDVSFVDFQPENSPVRLLLLMLLVLFLNPS